MSANMTIEEISTNRMVLKKISDGRKTVWNFVTPTNWHVGDTVAMQINRTPYDISFDSNGNLVISLPKEPPNEWKREFYTLFNTRNKDIITVDFESVEGFESLAEQAIRKATT